MSTEMLLAKEKLIKAIRTCLKNNNQPPKEKSISVLLAEESILTVMKTLEEKQIHTESMQEEQDSSQYWKPPVYYSDDDDDFYRESIDETPQSDAITTDLPITDSLVMEDEHLDTISGGTGLGEEIESVLRNLPNPSDIQDYLSDLLTEDVPVEILKILLETLSRFDEEIFSCENNSLLKRLIFLLKEVRLVEARLINPILPRIAEPNFDPKEAIRLIKKLLYDNSSPLPPEALNSEISDTIIKSFFPSPIPVEDKLLTNDSFSLPENESFHFNRYYVPSSPRPPEKPPDGDGIYFDIEPDMGVLTAFNHAFQKLFMDELKEVKGQDHGLRMIEDELGKMTRKPFPHRTERATDLLGILHTDVCGPLRHVSRQGAGYFITFTDDYSRYGYVYLLKHKQEVFETFKVFKNEVENQLGKTIKALRSDRGGEYISQEFKDYLKACGIVQQLTPLYTPQHNRVSERKNRTLLDMVRSMMNLTTMPLSFWDYALETATRILNMVPTKKVDKTPYELWIPKGNDWLLFLLPPENKIVVARYVEFLEKNLLSQEISRRAEELEEIQDEDTSPSKNTKKIPMEVEGFEPPQEEVVPIRRFARTHQAPDRLCLNVEVEEHSLGDLNEPPNFKAAILDLDFNNWVDAMNVEMHSIKDNQVWRLVDLPPNYKTVGRKWLFKKKLTWMAMYTPINLVLILIAITPFYDYEIWKMDIKTAFLNGYLDEDIFMVQPESFVDPNHPRKVCKRQRSIYGLKQASRSWNKRFDEEIKRFGFTQNLDEPRVYQKASGSNVTFIILYVDDIIIIGNHIPSLQSVKTYLGKCFAMKDLREATFILGIKIYRDKSKQLIGLS
ncbi:retrotransposon protein, putative, ty1-copia subclass [Tanacetum coccineum]